MTGPALLPGAAWVFHTPANAEELLLQMSSRLEDSGAVRESFPDAVVARERRFPTGLPTPVPSAIPHTDPEHVRRPGIAVALLGGPVDFAEMGGSGRTVPARMVCMLCIDDAANQVEALQTVLSRLQDGQRCERLLADGLSTPNEVVELVQDWLTGTDGIS